MKRIVEMVDPETNVIEWTGTLAEFIDANEDAPMSDDEYAYLARLGYVVLGGGACPVVRLQVAA